jgi:hypothetical protein
MKLFIGWRLFIVSIILAVPFFSWSITRIVKEKHFDDNCSYHISEALSADGIHTFTDNDYAIKEIDTAITYLENNNLTSGYTTITDKVSREDLSIFYNDIKKRSEYFHDLKTKNIDDIEKYKMYATMRNLHTRELDVPSGISIFPHNTFYCVWAYLSIICLILAVIGIITLIDQRSSIRH